MSYRRRERIVPDTGSVVSTTDVTFSDLSKGSKTTGASALTKLSTASKKEAAALKHVHRVLGEQLSVLRKVFQEVDPERDGTAPRQKLRDGIVTALRLHERWHDGLDRLLDLVDPTRTGSIIFGRLTRLVRTPFKEEEHVEPQPDGSVRRRRRFDVADDGDSELRATFHGVNTGDRQLLRRLGTPRSMPPMAAGSRATNILGDSRVRAPWAVAGDDARMNHILTSIHKERFADLVDVLKRHASPGSLAAAAPGETRLTYAQLRTALHEFDPFIHDAEILQYFMTMANDVRGINNERLVCSDGTVSHSTGADDSLLPGKYKRDTVSIDGFVQRFGKNVLAAPAMRCSATFALGWTLPPPRPPQSAPSTSQSKRTARASGRGASSPRTPRTASSKGAAAARLPAAAGPASARKPVPTPPAAAPEPPAAATGRPMRRLPAAVRPAPFATS